jgi:hypothetical protein
LLAVWDFCWMLTAPQYYTHAAQFNITVGLLAYPVTAWVFGKFIAESGDTRASLVESEVQLSAALTVRYRAVMDAAVKVADELNTDPTRCVVRVGPFPYVFEYTDGEWRFV